MKAWSKSILSNWKISSRINLLLALPFLGALLFSSMLTYSTWQEQNKTHELLELGSLAPKFSALVHELQKERGMSAGFIASKGVKFRAELPEQRTQTDNRQKTVGYGTQVVRRRCIWQQYRRRHSAGDIGPDAARADAQQCVRPNGHCPADGKILYADHRKSAEDRR